MIVQYNWTRPRDRSHYERFIPYHGAFYRFVEAASVTPFAARARDRALRGAVAALARSLAFDPTQNHINNPAAVAEALRTSMAPVLDAFSKRVSAIDEREEQETREELESLCEELRAFLLSRPNSKKYWVPWRVLPDDRRNADFVLSDGDGDHHGLWISMLSMRSTDDPSPVVLDS